MRGRYQVILFSPELLPEPPMHELLTHEPARRRVRLVMVDGPTLFLFGEEAHPGDKAFQRTFNPLDSASVSTATILSFWVYQLL